jgi:hypothetical protein
MVLGEMRELVAPGSVSDDMDPGIGGADAGLGDDAPVVDVDASSGETQTFDVRGAARCEQQVRADDFSVRSIGPVDPQSHVMRLAGARHDRGAEPNWTPSAASALETTATRSASSRGRMRGATSMTVISLPRRRKRLRHLATDRARTDDEQMRHGLAQVEEGLVREIRNRIEAGKVRDSGPAIRWR